MLEKRVTLICSFIHMESTSESLHNNNFFSEKSLNLYANPKPNNHLCIKKTATIINISTPKQLWIPSDGVVLFSSYSSRDLALLKYATRISTINDNLDDYLKYIIEINKDLKSMLQFAINMEMYFHRYYMRTVNFKKQVDIVIYDNNCNNFVLTTSNNYSIKFCTYYYEHKNYEYDNDWHVFKKYKSDSHTFLLEPQNSENYKPIISLMTETQRVNIFKSLKNVILPIKNAIYRDLSDIDCNNLYKLNNLWYKKISTRFKKRKIFIIKLINNLYCLSTKMQSVKLLTRVIKKFWHRPKLNKNKHKKGFVFGSPQRKGYVLRLRICTPKKPNSARRPCVKIMLSTKKKILSYIPGSGHNLRRHSKILNSGKGARDLPVVNYTCIRGVYDFYPLYDKTKRRSIYGVPTPEELRTHVRRKFREFVE